MTPLPPWLTALLNKICHRYLVTLTFDDPPPPPMAVSVVCEQPQEKFGFSPISNILKRLYYGITLLCLAPSGAEKLTFLKPKNSQSNI